MEVRIEGSFESLSQDEWDKYLSVGFFEDMFIKEGSLGESEDIFQDNEISESTFVGQAQRMRG